MRINSLEQPQRDPDINRDDVQVPREVTPKQRTRDRPGPENRDLGGMGVLSGKTERGGVLVVDLVDVFVEQRGVEGLVCEVVEHVFEEEEECDLGDHGLP